jgi:hypothetical protein
MSRGFHGCIDLPVLPEPAHVAAFGMHFDLTQQFHDVRLEARLARVSVGNHGLDLNRYDKAIGSDQPRSFDSLALKMHGVNDSWNL